MPTSQDYEFDVALSYGGAGKAPAEELANLLKEKGLDVYFDPDRRVDDFGNLIEDTTEKVYRDTSRFCVVFYSKEYIRDGWPKKELDFIKQRILADSAEHYAVLYKLDDTPVPAFLNDRTHVSPSDLSVIELAEKVAEKVAEKIQQKALKDKKLESSPACLVGLGNFEQEHNDFFLSIAGNQSQVRRLEETVKKYLITLLCGDLKDGKTSLIKAGLIPSLEKSTVTNWKCIYTSSGNNIQNSFFNILDFKEFTSGIEEDADATFESVIELIIEKHKDDKIKILVVIDQFEECEIDNIDLNSFLSKVNEKHKIYKSKISILISCRKEFSNHIKLLEDNLSTSKFFSQDDIESLHTTDSEKYLKDVLDIEAQEEEYFDELFNVLKSLSRKKLGRNNVYPPYLQIFGRWWETASEQSRMTSERWHRSVPYGVDISANIVMEDYWLYLKSNSEEKIKEIDLLHATLKDSVSQNGSAFSISQDSLDEMRCLINESMMNNLIKTIENYWFKNLITSMEKCLSSDLVESMKKQMMNSLNTRNTINEIYAANENICAIDLNEIFLKSQTTLHNFLKSRDNTHETVKTLMHLFIHYHCKMNSIRYPKEFYFPPPPPLKAIDEFYKVVKSSLEVPSI